MHIVIPHKLSQAAAIEKVKQGLAEGRAQIAEHATIEQEDWEGNTLHFAVTLQHKKITGTLAVDDTNYVLDATLPLMWRLFEGRIEKEVGKYVAGMK